LSWCVINYVSFWNKQYTCNRCEVQLLSGARSYDFGTTVCIIPLCTKTKSKKTHTSLRKLYQSTMVGWMRAPLTSPTTVVSHWPSDTLQASVGVNEVLNFFQFIKVVVFRNVQNQLKQIFHVYRQCFIQFVPNRSRETLWPIIQKDILPGSEVWSDMHATYQGLSSKPM